MRNTAMGGVVAALLASPVLAESNDWTFSASLYGWVPSLEASVTTAFGTVEADLSGSQILNNLDMAFMGFFEAQNGPWSVLLDIFHADLSGSKATPFGRLYSEAVVETKLAFISAYLNYRVYENASVSIDLGGGFRAFDTDIGLTLTPGTQPGVSNVASESWVDPLLAARIVIQFDDNWFGTAFFDVGGTGSDDNTWQALASVGYQFNDSWSAQIGYRHLDFENVIGGRATSMSLSGPFIGASYQF